MTHELQRSNQLILKLSETQQSLADEKLDIETDIMHRKGVNDEESWDRLRQVRAEIDSLYEEKL